MLPCVTLGPVITKKSQSQKTVKIPALKGLKKKKRGWSGPEHKNNGNAHTHMPRQKV